MPDEEHWREMRRVTHDMTQADRRTRAQNLALVEFLTEHKEREALWSISDLPPEGGDVTLGDVANGTSWVIHRDGTITAVS